MTERAGTDYELVKTAKEYSLCKEFLERNNITYGGKLSFPTIIARRGPEVIGVMGTHPTRNYILVEPIFANVQENNQSFVVMRLVQVYEGVLQIAGVSRYRFRFEQDDTKWISIIRKLSDQYRELGVLDDTQDIWFERVLQ